MTLDYLYKLVDLRPIVVLRVIKSEPHKYFGYPRPHISHIDPSELQKQSLEIEGKVLVDICLEEVLSPHVPL